ncbi:tol-pal system protein YbgF [Ancylobacter lacus]|uniref:tol-pal system protein YbgF n=1 Tax=Ancylobacter lacus TaxID=2579970 RepID=UPI001BCC6915|nr:tol-pal system protein YbgF [Ancylobacter lacus]MBS7540172.1 tol-pal system protein YbgF [Ancylobacter lacus]
MILRVMPLRAFLLSFGLAAVALPGSALAQQNGDFFGNLFKPPGQVGQGSQAPPAGESDAVSSRLDRIENQMRQMTGQIEELQFKNQQLEAQLKRTQQEMDYRAGGGAGAAAAAAGAAPAAAAAAPARAGQPAATSSRRSDAFDPNAQPTAPGAPRPLGTTPPSAPGSADGVGAPVDLGSGAPAAGGQDLATQPPTNTPKDLYDLAYGYVLRQDYAQASQGFQTFIRQYPSDRAVPDAYYWMGEADYQRQMYKEAAQSFLKVSSDYPNAVKAPDALLRLGQSLAAIGEKDAACATYNAVGNKYPKASATVRQGVEREQKRARC